MVDIPLLVSVTTVANRLAGFAVSAFCEKENSSNPESIRIRHILLKFTLIGRNVNDSAAKVLDFQKHL
jgi:hypothetical protein